MNKRIWLSEWSKGTNLKVRLPPGDEEADNKMIIELIIRDKYGAATSKEKTVRSKAETLSSDEVKLACAVLSASTSSEDYGALL